MIQTGGGGGGGGEDTGESKGPVMASAHMIANL